VRPRNDLERSLNLRELRDRREAERRGRPYVVFADSEGERRFIVLGDEAQSAKIGRKPDSQIALTWDRRASKDHAILERLADRWMIQDLGAKNGTWINGERLGQERRPLSDGDRIRAGGTVILFISDPSSDFDQTLAEESRPDLRQLTAAQTRVLRALCEPSLRSGSFVGAATNKEVASELTLTEDAVKKHLSDIYAAVGVSGLPQNRKRNEMVRLALESGLFRLASDARGPF
jgi:pSer/pThr/pTyr-binding forkhead associated (FHA) protein